MDVKNTSQPENKIEKLESRLERSELRFLPGYEYSSRDASMAQVNEALSQLKRDSMRAEVEEAPVTLIGEIGTGRETLSRVIHQSSRRAKGPWISLNCSQYNWDQLEEELFGIESTFQGNGKRKYGVLELANHGTLYLENIEFLSLETQDRIFSILRSKQFKRVGGATAIDTDVRVIAGSCMNPNDVVISGKFRSELANVLTKVCIDVPALRDRSSDILPLASAFAQKLFEKAGKKFYGFTPDFEQSLVSYGWPGNQRELYNVVERYSLFFTGEDKVSDPSFVSGAKAASGYGLTTARPFGPPRLELVGGQNVNPANVGGLNDSGSEGNVSYMSIKKKWGSSFERDYLVQILERHSGNVSAAARDAKLDRSNFLRLLRRHGIKAAEFRAASSASKSVKSEQKAA